MLTILIKVYRFIEDIFYYISKQVVIWYNVIFFFFWFAIYDTVNF